jgi:uncharacterized protein YjiS (DUF1127 family)
LAISRNNEHYQKRVHEPNMRITHMSTFPLRSSYATLAGPRAGACTSSWSARIAQGIELLMIWHERARQRHQLQGLSDHMLGDLGLGRADVEAEAAKPFWRL